MAVTQYDSLLESQKLKVDIGEVVPRPLQWAMQENREAPDTAYTYGDRYTGCYAAPTMVVYPKGGAFANAHLHTPLATTMK